MHSYEEKMRAVELYLKYDLSAASVINELEQHIKKRGFGSLCDKGLA